MVVIDQMYVKEGIDRVFQAILKPPVALRGTLPCDQSAHLLRSDGYTIVNRFAFWTGSRWWRSCGCWTLGNDIWFIAMTLPFPLLHMI